jgi:AmmeMemoRadiSam system protein B/AmmeMemoRadiSam system protein A
LLSRAPLSRQEGRLLALVVPHAGYQYSGQVAAYSYAQLRGRTIDTVILIGSAHHAAFPGASVYAEGKMRTPLGDVPVNREIANSLLDEQALVTFHPAAFEKEHSLEVQLPFLQTVLKDFSVVPVLIGTPTRETFSRLIAKVSEIARTRKNVLVIASTDLSHYHDAATAVRMDRKIIEAIEAMSPEEVERLLTTREGELCGGYAVLVTMAVARNLGATRGVLYGSANSGDVTGDRSHVVGYAALGLYRAALTSEERSELLALARRTIESSVRSGNVPGYEPKPGRLRANGAAFVTINRRGMLRGCIGNIQPVMPLYRAVQTNAVSAAARDPRFPPLRPEELGELQVEVTVLSPFERLKDIADIRIGTHGLYLVQGTNSGILLPQVAEEYRWDTATFLREVAVKAGLAADGWRDAQLYTFTAEVIR